jgi:gliding motility-associated-like protein
MVHGWGIKELIEFRIYNRNGNEVFFTDDINTGWNGEYDGKPQISGTYLYQIKAEMWDDSIKTINGTFNLLR